MLAAEVVGLIDAHGRFEVEAGIVDGFALGVTRDVNVFVLIIATRGSLTPNYRRRLKCSLALVANNLQDTTVNKSAFAIAIAHGFSATFLVNARRSHDAIAVQRVALWN